MPRWPFFCPYMNQFSEEDDDFRSPNGFPPVFPGQGQFQPPFGNQGTQGPPGPPPSTPPQLKQATVFAVDPGAISSCLYRFTFVRLDDGRRFWIWPTFVGPTSLAGFRWNGRRWVFFGVDLKKIEDFTCY